MRNFCIIANAAKEGSRRKAAEICSYLAERGCTASLYPGEYYPYGNRGVSEKKLDPGLECILVLGGDGTLIQVCRDMLNYQHPVYGINMGTVGYLMEVDAGNYHQALDSMIADRCQISRRMMIEGEVIRQGEVLYRDVALNDIVLNRAGSKNIIRFNLYVNGEPVNKYNADGIIVATPTGSTAYNLSAGGPIVSPEASLFVVTPICPHTISSRSVVLQDDIVIELEVDAAFRGGCYSVLHFDGGSHIDLIPGDRVRIYKSQHKAQLVRTTKESFLDVLRHKMYEGG